LATHGGDSIAEVGLLSTGAIFEVYEQGVHLISEIFQFFAKLVYLVLASLIVTLKLVKVVRD
jgi:hypothetical protein